MLTFVLHVDLSSCILEHMKDKTKRHEIVEFINRKKGYVLPECNLHKKTHCEMFCRDCRIPTCVLCVTTTHKKHDITRLGEIIENRKQQIVGDLKELEDVIVPAYKNVTTDVSSAENLSSRTEKRCLWQQYLKRNSIKLSTPAKAF